jgi:hypothetical protein
MRFGGIVLAALLTLGACSSDPQPREPRRTATSATPTATLPTMPPQAEKDTPEGAAAFVRHYIDVFNYAAKTGNTRQLRSLSDSCGPCESYARQFEDTYKRGDYFSRDLWATKKLHLDVFATGIDATVDVRATEKGQPVVYTLVFSTPRRPPFKVRDIVQVEEQ